MKLTAKGRYAVTAIADLAAQGDDCVVSLGEIAARQNISLSFLEQLFGKLRKAGLVESHRGQSGGYKLAVPAGRIKLDSVIAAVDEDIKLHGCTPEVKKTCTGTSAHCMTHSLWDALEAHIEGFLANISVADVVSQNIRMPEAAE